MNACNSSGKSLARCSPSCVPYTLLYPHTKTCLYMGGHYAEYGHDRARHSLSTALRKKLPCTDCNHVMVHLCRYINKCPSCEMLRCDNLGAL